MRYANIRCPDQALHLKPCPPFCHVQGLVVKAQPKLDEIMAMGLVYKDDDVNFEDD